MKHFTIQTHEQAQALRRFNSTPKFALKIGHIITPSAGVVTRAYWDDYPESDAITFEQCMSIVNDVVTEEVLRELGEVGELGACKFVEIVGGQSRVARSKTPPHRVYLFIADNEDSAMTLIPNPTATNIRLLTSILRGQ